MHHVATLQIIIEPLLLSRCIVLRLSKDKGSMKSGKGSVLQDEMQAGPHQVLYF